MSIRHCPGRHPYRVQTTASALLLPAEYGKMVGGYSGEYSNPVSCQCN